MKLSIIIPVFNEEKTIGKIIDKLKDLKIPCQKEIIVVDDGSTDKTSEVLSALQIPHTKFQILRHNKNLGKGAAIQTGIKHATGDYILFQDADLEYNPEEIPKLLSPVMSYSNTYNLKPKTFIAVYGSRFAHGKPVIPLLYYLGNIFLTKFTNLLYGCKLTDMETGYKLLPASFLKTSSLSGNRFEIEPEITVKLIKNNVHIVEVPISYKGRNRLAGKKLNLQDAWGAIKILLKYKIYQYAL